MAAGSARAGNQVTLGRGNIGGSKWSVIAFASKASKGRSGGVGCIEAVDAPPHGRAVKRSACGRIGGPAKADEAPLYALVGSTAHSGGAEPSGQAVLGIGVAAGVAKLTVSLEPGPMASGRTHTLSRRLAAKSRLGPFRYLALAVDRNVCVARMAGFDAKGHRVFSAEPGECPSSPTPSAKQTAAPKVSIETPIPTAAETALQGSVTPGGLPTSYRFEWGTSESYGHRVPAADASAGEGTAPKPVEAALGALGGGATYYFRLVAENAKGSGEGKGSFATPNWPPIVNARPATEVTPREATLHATVNPQGFGTRFHFEWGPTRAYGYSFESPTELTGQEELAVSQEINGLAGETIYFFRVVAESGEGSSEGKGTFVTPPSHFTRLFGTWSLLTVPNPAGQLGNASRLAGVSCGPVTSCMAAGEYQNEADVFQTAAERRNGSSWEVLLTPEKAQAVSLAGVSCVSPASCTAVGHYSSGESNVTLAEHWNGTEWQIQTTPNPSLGGVLTAISCSATNECTAVGYYKASASETRTLAERWNGSSWSVQETPSDPGASVTELTGVSCNAFLISGLFERECVAVGFAKHLTGSNGTFSARWEGSEWKSKPVPLPEEEAKQSFLTGISCAPTTECEAVGYLENKNGSIVSISDLWSGIFNPSWQAQAPREPTGAKLGKLLAVSCNDTRGLECMAVGEYESSSSAIGSFADQWFGSEGWEVLSTLSPAGAKAAYLRGISCVAGGECVADGYYEDSSGVDVVLAEEYR